MKKTKILNWYNLPSRFQEKLIPGEGIEINDKNEISVTSGSGGVTSPMTEITHADLLALVNSNSLLPGQQYRITDYVATVDESIYNGEIPPNGWMVVPFARSNNHAFDIIVIADSVNKLNENARAIRHEGDTYFPSHTKFEAWKIKYTIYNDTDRFDWALNTGKGVIYQLIDEWNNDLPYDFKSIQFQRNSVWVYTFGGITDASLEVQNCYENKILSSHSYSMNGYGLNNNTFGYYCRRNTFGNQCYSNIFGDECHSNNFGNNCHSNTFGYYCYSNTFGNECNSNIFGDECYSNNFGIDCRINTFGNGCSLNTFGYECSSNTFGNSYRSFNLSSYVGSKNFTTLISLFTTPPNGNTVNVVRAPTGVVMSQVINATTTESFNI